MTDIIEEYKKLIPLMRFMAPEYLADTLKAFVEIHDAHKKATVPFSDGDIVKIGPTWDVYGASSSQFQELRIGQKMIIKDIHWCYGDWSCSIGENEDSQNWFDFRVKHLLPVKIKKKKKK